MKVFFLFKRCQNKETTIAVAIKNDTATDGVVICIVDPETQMQLPKMLSPCHQKYHSIKYHFLLSVFYYNITQT